MTTAIKVLFIIATSIFLVGIVVLVTSSPRQHDSTDVDDGTVIYEPLLKTPTNYHITLNDIPVKLSKNGFPLKYSSITGELVPLVGESVSRISVISNPPNKTIYLKHPPDQIRKGSEIISDVLIPSGKHVTLSQTRVPYIFKYATPIQI